VEDLRQLYEVTWSHSGTSQSLWILWTSGWPGTGTST